jgi:hypothetical protein
LAIDAPHSLEQISLHVDPRLADIFFTSLLDVRLAKPEPAGDPLMAFSEWYTDRGDDMTCLLFQDWPRVGPASVEEKAWTPVEAGESSTRGRSTAMRRR